MTWINKLLNIHCCLAKSKKSNVFFTHFASGFFSSCKIFSCVTKSEISPRQWRHAQTGGDYFGFLHKCLFIKFRRIKDNTASEIQTDVSAFILLNWPSNDEDLHKSFNFFSNWNNFYFYEDPQESLV